MANEADRLRNDRGSDLRGMPPRRMLPPDMDLPCVRGDDAERMPAAGMACSIVDRKPLSAQTQRGVCGAEAQELTPYLNAYGTVPSSSTV